MYSTPSVAQPWLPLRSWTRISSCFFRRHMKRLLLILIKGYRKFISPIFPSSCRFTPTCSQFGYEAIEKYGSWKGGWLALKRICRCNPFHRGGHDPVP
ncbi:MAG: membrane protein insertion efficiency factor YidD [Acidobacteria bacterium CG_4_9_14_3_um_filter_49_7]|nr:MAG: membrane protein insertion efficiency factor YidD [Acidobacteria bacterium CG_4_9_14_3_um_filter_49_7]